MGGCGIAQIQTWLSEINRFATRTIHEIPAFIAFAGNAIGDEQEGPHHQMHACIAHKTGGQHCAAGGHLKLLTVPIPRRSDCSRLSAGNIR